MKYFVFLIFLFVGANTISSQTSTDKSKQETYKTEVREKLKLDYNRPDYSISRIDAKLMGSRLAKILETICENYQQYMNLSALSVIQSSQVEGLNYVELRQLN